MSSKKDSYAICTSVNINETGCLYPPAILANFCKSPLKDSEL